jgi:glutaminyl-peptide cyclotransferase
MKRRTTTKGKRSSAKFSVATTTTTTTTATITTALQQDSSGSNTTGFVQRWLTKILPLSSKSSSTPATSTYTEQLDKTWLKGMAVLLGCIVVAVMAFSIRTRDMPSKQTHGTSTTTNNHDDVNHLLQKKWDDFDGYAKIRNNYRLVQRYHHDPTAFTQGLQWHNDRMIESTGMHGTSQVRIYDPRSGSAVEQRVDLDDAYFGEGLCWFRDAQSHDRYIQLTWMERTAFVYNAQTLEVVQTFNYTTTTSEGWGITFDPKQHVFYVSDGSDTIHVWDLDFVEIRSFRVSIRLSHPQHNENPYLSLINELEWDPNDETILANVWFQNAIVRIHPQTGHVLEVFDLSQLYPERTPEADVMNGIAHYQGNQWWVTGKYWPYLYLLELR